MDKEGTVLGSATRGECHSGSLLLHPVVHLHVFNSRGDIYLQRRPSWKDIQPGKWDTAVGGHIDYGETPCEALHRETRAIMPSTDELDGGRFWTMQEVRDAMGKGVLTPNLESELKRCFARELYQNDTK